jgi:hypothetical protein
MNKLFISAFLLVLIAIIFGCKKYPENNLWFKNPEKLMPFFDTHLTKYQVNDIDSLDLLNKYFGNRQGILKDIRLAEFKTVRNNSYNDYLILFKPSLSIPFTYEFTSKKKKIRFNINADTSIFKKNIFMSNNIEWSILRLARKGSFKIETRLSNGNHYEIEIE